MRSLTNIMCRLSLVSVMLFSPLALNAATYYVDDSASNDSGNGSKASPKKYINSGLALMSSSGGDTLIIMPGTYTGTNNHITSSTAVNGKPGAYNIIKAQTDGTVTINAPFNLAGVNSAQSSYLQFEGLKWRDPSKGIVGHHIKIKRCAFEGGQPSGNAVTFGIGTNNQSPGASDILIEDSWFYGEGGRYDLLVYNSERVVLRRIVARHDTGWCFNTCGGSGPPEAGVTIYNSRDIRLQNFIVLDSNLIYQYWESAFYIINNTALFDNDNTVVDGSMSINNRGVSFKYDGSRPITNAVIRNSVSYGMGDQYGFGVALTGPAGSDSVLQNLTLMNGGTGVLVGSSASTNTLTNSILEGNSIRAITNNSGSGAVWTHTYNNCSNNTSDNCFSTGETFYNARTNGLLYPVRVEANSTLATAGKNGAPVGATIVSRIGVSGTLYNENGFETVTSEALWPWPNEQRIKTDMCDEISTGVADRGWCATNLSLTQYIWGLLGNSVPGSLTPMPSPQNARSVKN